MMRIVLFIICFFASYFLAAQKKYVLGPYALENDTIYKIANQYKKNKVLMYVPEVGSEIFSSVLFVKEKDTAFYWVFKNDEVWFKGRIVNGEIFNYKNYLKTGVVKSEDQLKFVPPALDGIISYKDTKNQFFFEIDKSVTYEPDVKREKYRKEWIGIIKEELQSLFSMIDKNYIGNVYGNADTSVTTQILGFRIDNVIKDTLHIKYKIKPELFIDADFVYSSPMEGYVSTKEIIINAATGQKSIAYLKVSFSGNHQLEFKINSKSSFLFSYKDEIDFKNYRNPNYAEDGFLLLKELSSNHPINN